MRQTLTELKKETDSSKIIIDDFNTELSIMARTSRGNINKEMNDLT